MFKVDDILEYRDPDGFDSVLNGLRARVVGIQKEKRPYLLVLDYEGRNPDYPYALNYARFFVKVGKDTKPK